MTEITKFKGMACSRSCDISDLGLDLEDAIVSETVGTLMQCAKKNR